MDGFKPGPGLHGVLLQSASPKTGLKRETAHHARGLLVRGVVISTYTVDEPNVAVSSPIPGEVQNARAVYCDVLVYSGMDNSKKWVLKRVLVSQDRGGMHENDIWIPRPTTLNVSGVALDQLMNNANPGDLDGENVLIGFMDDDLWSPVILRGVPHPNTDRGNENHEKLGSRTLPLLRDVDVHGIPRITKHRGSFYGIDGLGNFVADLRNAHDGVYASDGTEVPPDPDDIKSPYGSFAVRLPQGASCTIEVEGPDGSTRITVGNSLFRIKTSSGLECHFSDDAMSLSAGADRIFDVRHTETGAELRLGDGGDTSDPTGKHVAIVEHLETLYNALKAYIESAQVLTALGPSSPIVAQSGPAPSWDAAINSSKMSLPDG